MDVNWPVLYVCSELMSFRDKPYESVKLRRLLKNARGSGTFALRSSCFLVPRKVIKYVDVPAEAARTSMLGTGMSAEIVEGLLEHYRVMKLG